MITIIDYGMGNLWSVINAFKRYSSEVRISSRPEDVKKTDKLVLPGVGAFKHAYDELETRGLVSPVIEFINSGKPFLGLCLGLQLLFTKSHEDGEHKGFGVISGEVRRFPGDRGLKVPHMGWNGLIQNPKSKIQNCPVLKGVPDGAYMYFVHSYYVVPQDKSVIATTTDYGIDFCSMVWKDNIYAMQFHPEKSQVLGLKMIENFAELK